MSFTGDTSLIPFPTVLLLCSSQSCETDNIDDFAIRNKRADDSDAQVLFVPRVFSNLTTFDERSELHMQNLSTN